MAARHILAVIVLVTGCKSDGKNAVDQSAKPTSGSASGGAASGTGSSTPALAGSAAPSGSATVAAPLDPKIAAARCDEPCLFLVDTPLGGMADAYKKACGKAMADFGFEDCKLLDQVRKCIYAAHGFVFKQKKWKSYERKPWYVAHADFKPTQISALERANVVELDARAKGCKKGLTVSAADLARVEAWVAGVEKRTSPIPKLTTADYEPATADQLFTFLQAELVSFKPAKLDLGKDTTVSYESGFDPNDAELRAKLHAAPTTKLRMITIAKGDTIYPDKDNPITEGVEIEMIYDDHDQLVALEAHHMMLD